MAVNIFKIYTHFIDIAKILKNYLLKALTHMGMNGIYMKIYFGYITKLVNGIHQPIRDVFFKGTSNDEIKDIIILKVQ